jgi:hypothetical protein
MNTLSAMKIVSLRKRSKWTEDTLFLFSQVFSKLYTLHQSAVSDGTTWCVACVPIYEVNFAVIFVSIYGAYFAVVCVRMFEIYELYMRTRVEYIFQLYVRNIEHSSYFS